MSVPDYSTLSVAHDAGVATVTIDNPAVNVLGAVLMANLRRVVLTLAADEITKVVVFESANPDFFIAHVDMTLIDDPPAFDEIAEHVPPGLNVFQALGELVRTLPQGHDRENRRHGEGWRRGVPGGLRHGRCPKGTYWSGTSGSVDEYRPERRRDALSLHPDEPWSRAGDHPGCRPVRCGEAAAYGWINRALPADELDGFVSMLARNIALLPEGVAQAVKRVLPATDLMAGFAREEAEWARLFSKPAAERLIREGLSDGAQPLG